MPANSTSDLHLIIGNKNFSSWSLRGWLALRLAGLPFRETVIRLDRPETKGLIRQHSAAGRVPVLRHGDLTVWDTMAITEYVAELAPGAALWPADTAARAVARSVAAEMHAGFAALRDELPMDIMGRHQANPSGAAQADIDRVVEIWRTCREAFGGNGSCGSRGPFLFGPFTAADVMYAPVVTRLVTYGVPVDAATQRYMESVQAHPAMEEWRQAAAAEVEAWGPTL